MHDFTLHCIAGNNDFMHIDSKQNDTCRMTVDTTAIIRTFFLHFLCDIIQSIGLPSVVIVSVMAPFKTR